MKNGRRKKEVEKNEAFHANISFSFRLVAGSRGKQTIFISLNTVNLRSRGVGWEKNGVCKMGHTPLTRIESSKPRSNAGKRSKFRFR